jgi:WD40 repeat protein
MRGHKGSISCLQVGTTGRSAISGSYDNTLYVSVVMTLFNTHSFFRLLWDYRHKKSAMSLIGHQGPIMSLLWEPDQNRVISGSRDTSVRVWDTRNGKTLHVLNGHADWVKRVALDGDLLVRYVA